jgi:thiosulfate reductase/polysulfide reductase chain A
LFNWVDGAILREQSAAKVVTKTPTYCEVCFWKCAGWVVKDENDEIWKIEGHADDPHCNGRLCPRGTGGVGMYHDEDRLKTPMIRVEENGQQVFKKVSWQEALGVIAEKMKAISDKYGPESMALFTHGSGGKFLGHLMKAYSTFIRTV